MPDHTGNVQGAFEVKPMWPLLPKEMDEKTLGFVPVGKVRLQAKLLPLNPINESTPCRQSGGGKIEGRKGPHT